MRNNKINTNIIIVIFSVLFAQSHFAQNNLLINKLNNTKSDSIKLVILSELSNNFLKTNTDSAIIFAKKAILIANKRNKIDELANSYKDLGFAYNNNGESLKALENFYLAIDNFNIEITKKNNNTKQNASKLSILHNNVGEILVYSDNFTKAREYINKSFEINKKYSLLNLKTNTLINEGLLYYKMQNLDSAVVSWKKALNNAIVHKQTDLEGRILTNLGSIFYHKKDFVNALNYYKKAYLIHKTNNDYKSIIPAANNLGLIYNALNYPDSVIKYSKEAEVLSRKFKQYYSNIISLNNITISYITTSITDSAKRYHELTLEAIGNYYTKQNNDRINELVTKYDVEKKNKKIELLKNKEKINELESKKRQTQLIIIVFTAIFIITIGIALFINYRRQQILKKHKLESKRLEIEQRMLRSQMNPHFIFNALNSIQSFIATNNINDAEVFLSKFALLIRSILENSSKAFIQFDKEKEALNLYLQLEQLRFNNKFSYSITSNLEDSFLTIPPMLIQPFVENAIIHGLRGKEKNGNINIIFNENDENSIICTVTDNGIGRKKAKELLRTRKNHKSFALNLTKDRLNFYNDKKNNIFKMDIIDLYDDNKDACGTKINLIIPFK